jgi:DNA-binding SARP family transcriptional activator
MRFDVLGSLVVWRDGGEVRLSGLRQRRLLAVLLLRANEVVSTSSLLDDLWGGRPPASAGKAVKALVWQLRKQLGEGVIETARGGYLLRASREAIDSRRFEDLIGRAQRLLADGAAAEAEAVLREALALWRGTPFAEFVYEEFARNEIGRLGELRLVARELLAEADLALGHNNEVVRELQGLVVDHPMRERPRGLLMLALYRAGRQADALALYQEGRAVLVEELGLEPSESLKQMEQAILRHDPSLEPSQPAATEPLDEADALARTQTDVAAVPVRKTVTVLACAVANAAGDRARLDPESLQLLMSRYFEAAAAVLARHGGAVETFVGDGVVGVFGVPVLHEDDAERAVRAAAELRTALGELNRGLERDFGATLALRIGISTGEVVTGSGARLATEGVVAAATDLQQTAAPGEIVLSQETLALVPETVQAEQAATAGSDAEAARGFRLLAVEPRAPRVARRLDAPMVGRARELALLQDAFATTTARPGCTLVTVLGAAGVGKSRLAREFLSGVDARVLEGRCLSYGDGITYWPLVEVVAQLQGAHGVLLAEIPGAATAIASLLGESAAPTSPEEIAWAARKLFEALARERPLVVLIDDLHWAEPTFHDLVEHVVQLSQGAPILLLCLARPELVEVRPGWAAGLANATTVVVEPLDTAETDELIGHLLHGLQLADGLAGRIQHAAGGNPLFVEEMLAMLQASGADDVAVPPTIRALLAARIDQLDPAERQVLGCGSIEGQLFHRGAVEALRTPPHPAEHELAALVRKELLRPDQPQLPPDEAYRFRHLLIRDAAYEALPKAARAQLHERLASWLDRHAMALVERDELVGYHLEQAHLYHIELSAPEAETCALGERAAAYLVSAGRRATAKGDFRAANNLLERALQLGIGDPRERVRVQGELSEALYEAGRNSESESSLTAALKAASGLGASDLATRALVQLEGRRVLHMEVDLERLVAVAEDAIRVLGEPDDAAGLALAEELLATSLSKQGREAASLTAAERGLAHAIRSGEHGTRRNLVRRISARLLAGPIPVTDASYRCEELLRSCRDDPTLQAAIGRNLSALLAMAARFDEALGRIEKSDVVLDELDSISWTWRERWVNGLTRELAGDREGAERDLLAQWLKCRDAHGPRSVPAVNASSRLALLYCDEGRWEDAENCLTPSQGLPEPTWFRHAAVTRLAAQALVTAHHGDHDEATRLAHRAVELCEPTDCLELRPRLWVAFADVQRAVGQMTEADAAVSRALELYEQKGNIAAASRLRAAYSVASST